jgi:hypothetical protein
MKELYVEGLASHNDHESCAGNRKAAREALTVARAGWVLSPENQQPKCRPGLCRGKATPKTSIGEMLEDLAWSETPKGHLPRDGRDCYMRGNSMHGNRESLGSIAAWNRGPRWESN